MFVADLHIHSPHSRATSSAISPETLTVSALQKGISLMGTGDYTHPRWLAELEEKFEPAEEGLYRLKPDHKKAVDAIVPKSCRGEVRFILQTEISTIYKKTGKTRKVHHLILLPDFASAKRLILRLERIGNLKSDGRPILGLDSRNLLEIALEASERVIFIPAHIWTPWFSVFGSKSGFDHLEECYEELTPHIAALETGLSSDPPMNWLFSELDAFTLVSNSDAHSPAKLGREANLFDVPFSYQAVRDALVTGEGMAGTIEFFPEEGKYHLDGHRKCDVRLEPSETFARGELCPVCGKPVTVGVMNRVEALADRQAGFVPPKGKPFYRLMALDEVLSEILSSGPATKTVQSRLRELVEKWGPELHILRELPVEQVETEGMSVLAEALRRLREGRVYTAAGYDGEYGTVKVFAPGEMALLEGQRQFLIGNPVGRPKKRKEPTGRVQRTPIPEKQQGEERAPVEKAKPGLLDGLNPAQRSAILHRGSHLMIVAGPGTGKTLTLTRRAAYLIETGEAAPRRMLAVTFTQRAAREMAERLGALPGKDGGTDVPSVMTLHAFGYTLLRSHATLLNLPDPLFLADERSRVRCLTEAAREAGIPLGSRRMGDTLEEISRWKQTSWKNDASESEIGRLGTAYNRAMARSGNVDYDDLLLLPLRLMTDCPEVRDAVHDRFRFIFVDEFQDLNPLQAELIKRLAGPECLFTVIGDPDQSIYGFRGASPERFPDFERDFSGVRVVRLDTNYRSCPSVLSGACDVIRRNPSPFPRELTPVRTETAPIRRCVFESPKSEAVFIAHEIDALMGGTSHFAMNRAGGTDTLPDLSFRDIAVLYRFHALSGPVEETLSVEGIPFQRYGDSPVRAQAVVNGLLAGLRWMNDTARDEDLLTLLSLPNGGFAPETLDVLRTVTGEHSGHLWHTVSEDGRADAFSPAEGTRLAVLTLSLRRMLSTVHVTTPARLLAGLLAGLTIPLPDETSALSAADEPLRRLLRSAEGWRGDLLSFIDEWSLFRETDLYDPRADRVTLLTAHAAKGLEFPVVFVLGMEDGVFPHVPGGEQADMEEERRLFYVSMTRAKDVLYLTRSTTRTLWGTRRNDPPSRFLSEIGPKYLMEYPEQGKRKSKPAQRQLSLF